MADKFFELLEKHKMAFVGVTSIVLMVFLIGMNSCSAASKAEQSDQMTFEQSQDADVPVNEDTGPVVDDPTGEFEILGDEKSLEGDDSSLSKAQKELIQSYGETEKKLIARLEGAVWVGSDGKGRLEFKDNRIMEKTPTDSGSKKKSAISRSGFAISSISNSSPLMPQDGSVSETDAVVLLEDGSYQILRVLEETPQSGNGVASTQGTVVADFLSREYTNAFSASELKVDGLKEKNLKQALNGNTKELQASLREWCEVNHPTATEAVWDEAVTYDYANRTVQLQFALTDPFGGENGDDDPSQNTVLVIYHTDTDEFEEADAQ